MKRKRNRGVNLNLDDIFADVEEVWPCHSFCTVCGEQLTEEISMMNYSRKMSPPVCPECKEGEEDD